MNRIQKKTNPVQGVAYGQVPTVTFQIGPRYRTVLFEVIATAAAGKVLTLPDVLGDIVFKGSNNPWRTHTAWQLDQIQRSYGAQYAYNAYNYDGGVLHYTGGTGVPDGPVAAKQTIFYVPVYLRQPWRSSYAVRDMYAWPTAWPDGSVLSSLTAELTVPAASANVLANSTLSINCYTETDNQLGSVDKTTKKPIMLIERWERSGKVYGGSGLLVIDTLPKKDVLNQISAFASYATGQGPVPGRTPAQLLADQNDTATPAFDAVLSAKIEVDNVTIRDVASPVNEQFLMEDDFNEAALPADRLDIVFDKSDRPDDGLALQAGGQTVKSFNVTLQVGQPGAAVVALQKSVTLLTMSYGPPPGNS